LYPYIKYYIQNIFNNCNNNNIDINIFININDNVNININDNVNINDSVIINNNINVIININNYYYTDKSFLEVFIFHGGKNHFLFSVKN